MPKPETLEALRQCFDAFYRLLQLLGPGWTLLYCVLVGAITIWFLIWRARQPEKAWERALGTKDQMIEQINEQNRELRVQVMVVGGIFTKEEAVTLVYGEDRLKGGNSGPPPPQIK